MLLLSLNYIQSMPTLIVTNRNREVKGDAIRIHTDHNEAIQYGKETYGYGQFRILPYHTWKRTKKGKRAHAKVAILKRMRQWR